MPPPRARLVHALTLLLAGLLTGLLSACAALPPRGAAPVSHAIAAEEAAGLPLARIASASRPADATGASGFRLLPTGEYALEARLALAQRATRTLDLQVYHLHRDQAGRALLRALRDAAARGVRVRLLADDFYAAEVEDLLAGLAAHDGVNGSVQVRLFNPLSLRWGPPVWRLAMSRGDFELNNHRMHNKLFVADGAMALFGGRNVADEYYMGSHEANFIDMDLLATGAVVTELSAVFDRYWNSAQAWPLARVRDMTPPGATLADLRQTFDAAVQQAALPRAPYSRDPLGHGPVGAQLAAGRLDGLAWAEARVHADPPEKAEMAVPRRDPTEAMAGLIRAMATTRRYVAIVSPYFVPNEPALANMREARRHGIRIIVVTNSLASTDEPLVHASYALRRPELLKMGVELHEISPALISRTEHYGVFGRSVPRLHAKVAIVDGLRVLVGSVNLDARSAIGNTEMGVVIESPQLATELQRLMQAPGAQAAGSNVPNVAMYRVTLADDGQTLQWRARDASGQEHITTDEPGSSAWLRFTLWLQSLVVPERLL